jgi:hypothetical protein
MYTPEDPFILNSQVNCVQENSNLQANGVQENHPIQFNPWPPSVPKRFFDVDDLKYQTRRALSQERSSDTPSAKRNKEKNRKRREKRRLKLQKRLILKNENAIKKKKILKLVYLTPMSSDINPINYVRVMDHVFLLDASCINGSVSSSESWNKQGTLVYGDPRFFKRISKVHHDKFEGKWTFTLEEKFGGPNQNMLGGEGYLSYFTDWLKSLGHPKSDRLALMLGKYFRNLIKNFADEEILYDLSVITRKYQKRLKEETRTFINQHPHFIRVQSFDPVKMD